jgi:hypothetical protein
MPATLNPEPRTLNPSPNSMDLATLERRIRITQDYLALLRARRLILLAETPHAHAGLDGCDGVAVDPDDQSPQFDEAFTGAA